FQRPLSSSVCPCPACGLLFFFQAEDGIRDFHVTGVQTCALPIYRAVRSVEHDAANGVGAIVGQCTHVAGHITTTLLDLDLHFQLAGSGQRGGDVFGIHYLVVARYVVAGGGDSTCDLSTTLVRVTI